MIILVQAQALGPCNSCLVQLVVSYSKI